MARESTVEVENLESEMTVFVVSTSAAQITLPEESVVNFPPFP